MLVYIVIGIIFMFLIEFGIHSFEEELEFYGEDTRKFNMGERIFGILVLPLIIILFIRSLLK